MVREWSPEKPTRLNTSSGDLPPNRWRKKNSGISRPEVEAREPKVKDLPAMILRELLGRLQPRLGVGDHVGLERDVLGALRDRLRARHRAARLDAGEAAEPGELHLVVGEGRDRGRIALHRQIFHGHAELLLQVVGDFREALDEAGLVLVGDRGEHEGLGLRRGRRDRQRQTRRSATATPSLIDFSIGSPRRLERSEKERQPKVSILAGIAECATVISWRGFITLR